jgi:hypothetical protein
MGGTKHESLPRVRYKGIAIDIDLRNYRHCRTSASLESRAATQIRRTLIMISHILRIFAATMLLFVSGPGLNAQSVRMSARNKEKPKEHQVFIVR